MSVLNSIYGKLKSREDWKFTEDFTLIANAQLDASSNILQQIPISFKNANLDLNAIQGASAAYLVLRHIHVAVKKNRIYHESTRGYAWSGFLGHTVPASTTGDIYQTTINPSPYGMTYARKLKFATIPAGVTITKVEIAPTLQNSNFVDLATGNFTTPQDIDLEAYFGAGYGLTANSRNTLAPGIDVRITANNTNGSGSQFIIVVYGTADTDQSSQWLVQYIDNVSQPHNVGMFDDYSRAMNFAVDRIIAIPITDPTKQDYGNLLFTNVYRGEDYYNDGNLYTIVINASIAYLVSDDLSTQYERSVL